jgi:hypothetical protein
VGQMRAGAKARRSAILTSRSSIPLASRVFRLLGVRGLFETLQAHGRAGPGAPSRRSRYSQRARASGRRPGAARPIRRGM